MREIKLFRLFIFCVLVSFVSENALSAFSLFKNKKRVLRSQSKELLAAGFTRWSEWRKLCDLKGNLEKQNITEQKLLLVIKYGGLRNIRTLNLSGNISLFSLPKEIKGLNKLRELYLSHTGVSEIFLLPKYLKVLDVSDTPVKRLPVLSKMLYLKEIYLGGTGIKDIDGHMLPIGLVTLDASNCRSLTKVLHFGHLKNLKYIILRRTSVGDISTLSLPVSLVIFDVGKSSVSNLPKALSRAINLKELDASKTKTVQLPSLKRLRKLKLLNLEGTKISSLNWTPFNKKLSCLNLLRTPLAKVLDYSLVKRAADFSLTKEKGRKAVCELLMGLKNRGRY
jgi:Leucine-rich repeat (LRR) protein